MAVLNLSSLVLRGVSVLGDGQTVNRLRRDASATAIAGAPTIRISMRHPSSGCQQAFMQPAERLVHEDENLVAQAVPGAGRSLSRAGVLSRRSPAVPAGRITPTGWSTPERLSATAGGTNPITGWRLATLGGQSPEKSVADTTKSPFGGVTSFTAPIVTASTRGT